MKRLFHRANTLVTNQAISIILLLCASMAIDPSVTLASLEKSSKKECAMCHVMWLDVFRTEKETLIEWQPGNVLMKDTQGIVSSEEMCYSCHDGYVLDSRASAWKDHSHPVFKTSSKEIKIPEILPLSNKNEIYCGTCHSPHGGPGALPADATDEAMSRGVSFMRLPNIDSGLCERCHGNKADYKRTNGHPVHTDKLKIPEALFEWGSIRAEKKDTVICQTCHSVHGAKGRKLTLVDNGQSALCTECHRERTLTGTSHDLRVTMPTETNGKGQSVSESGPCGACHVPHNSAGYPLWARRMSPDAPVSQICFSCHKGQPDSKVKGIGRHSHPNDVNPDSEGDQKLARSIRSDKLPFFSPTGRRQATGSIQCLTCHNIHQWDPVTATNRGGKGIEGDASNSFLRMSNSRSSALCMECHSDKQQVLSFDHNLARTAPKAENIRGDRASVSGPCGACHIPHNAAGPQLWARKLSKDEALVPQYCLGCHAKNGAAKDKPTGKNDHPVDVASKGFSVAPLAKVSAELPLFSPEGGAEPGDAIRCLTCHDPHLWDPGQPDLENHPSLENREGSGANSFLRKSNAPVSYLCEVCHGDMGTIEGTDHDLSVTAPKATNLLGQSVAMSGTCGTCHIAHGSPNDLKLWARPYGPISPDDHRMDSLCTSCHSKGNIAETKVPLIRTHPKGKLIENTVRFENSDPEHDLVFEEEALIYTPIFNNMGKRVNVGDLSCPSCHFTHQWSALTKGKGSYQNAEGSAESSFLRTLSYKNVCVYCHGRDALFRYRLFHSPAQRRGVKGAEIPKGSP